MAGIPLKFSRPDDDRLLLQRSRNPLTVLSRWRNLFYQVGYIYREGLIEKARQESELVCVENGAHSALSKDFCKDIQTVLLCKLRNCFSISP